MSQDEFASKPPHTLQIEEEMTIYQAAEMKPMLLAALQDAPRIEIDLSRVGHIDTAGLQLLVMLKRKAAALGHELTLVRHSFAVLEAFDLVGLAGFFGDPIILHDSAPASDGQAGGVA